MPMASIVGKSYTDGRAWSFLRARQRLEVVVNQRMSAVTERNCIRTALVVGHVGECYRCPRVAIVTAEGGCQLTVTGTHEHLQSSVFQFQNTGLYAVNRVFAAGISHTTASGASISSTLVAVPAFMSSVRMAGTAATGPTYFHCFVVKS